MKIFQINKFLKRSINCGLCKKGENLREDFKNKMIRWRVLKLKEKHVEETDFNYKMRWFMIFRDKEEPVFKEKLKVKEQQQKFNYYKLK